ncbi:DUF4190 domain-containing protein [Kitasatospora azatica]|uniref:DUF4190 domain-containing protein n=1 Tax=Kitasatospora azatica TaxID=58347 RepID=UPI00055EE38A|nr:DUF4190 domain-containing protein [Kitasatospora azatica]
MVQAQTVQPNDVIGAPAPASASVHYPPSGTNRFARWARLSGLLGLAPVALVLGVIGLVQVRRTGQRGKGAAVLGLVAALLWTGIWANLATAFTPHVQRGSNGGVAVAQADSVLDLHVGDCFRDTSHGSEDGLDAVILVPCDHTYDGKVYATPVLGYQKDLTSEMAAKAACRSALPADTPSGAAAGFLYPNELLYEKGTSRASCYTRP